MSRRFRFSLILTFSLSGLIFDASSTQAQGLLRRIQSRIQARLQPPPPLPSVYPAPVAPAPPVPPSVDPRGLPSPNGSSGLRRLSPIEADPRSPIDRRSVPENPPGGLGESILSREPDRVRDDYRVRRESVNRDPVNRVDSSGATIGINVFESSDLATGIQIDSFRPESLADEAGMRVGDVITAINTVPVLSSRDVALELRGLSVGEPIDVVFVRNRISYRVSIPLVSRTGEREPTLAAPSFQSDLEPLPAQEFAPPKFERDFGSRDRVMDLAPPTQEAGSETETLDLPAPVRPFGVDADNVPGIRGARVKTVVPGSPADSAGILPGDRIVSIDGDMVVDSDALFRRMDNRKSDDVVIQFVRDAKLVAADVDFTARPDSSLVGSESSATSESTKPDSANTESAAESAAQGIGSLLGGLFGGKSEPPKDSDDSMAFDDDEQETEGGLNDQLRDLESKSERVKASE